MATKKATRREQVTSNRPRPQKNIWSGYNEKRYEGMSTEEKLKTAMEEYNKKRGSRITKY